MTFKQYKIKIAYVYVIKRISPDVAETDFL